MMGSVHVESDEILVSFDVSSLFTNVPVREAVSSFVRGLGKTRHWGRGPLSPQNRLQIYWRCA